MHPRRTGRPDVCAERTSAVKTVRYPTLPLRVGLSHVGELVDEADEEGVVPGCGFDLLLDGEFGWMDAQDVEGELSQDREVLGSIVLSRAIGVLAQDDVEKPVQVVLDRPSTS